jgi:signal transduction histidine kinase
MLDDPNSTPAELPAPRRERPGGRQGSGGEFRLERLAQQRVEFEGRVLGDVLVLHPRQRVPLFSALPARAVALLPVGLLVALVAGLLLSHRLQRRLFALEEHAVRVGDGDLSGRLPSPGRDEIGRVAESLNAMTERLAASSEELRVSDTRRRQLLADITHELATPLTAIRGYTETLLDEGIEVSDPDRVRYLQDVLAAAQRMDLLVRDLLDLARVEAGAGDFTPEALDFSELVRHSVERIGRAAPSGAPSLEWQADATGSTQVFADGRRLEQLVDNLLHNALRHGATGDRVEVRVSGAEGRVRLEVRDHGPGFDPADLPHVFDRFYRADRARTTPGSGLGLAIVRAIAERHGGTARAENASPAGARLVVELPASD